MAFMFRHTMPAGNGQRLKGLPRYSELLERDWKRFFTVNLLTLLGFLPLAAGILAAILSSSILILVPSCIIGGAIAGPALSCMHDTIFRSLRDAPGRCMDNYRHAFRQNWRQSILPGILCGLLLGFYSFMLMLFWWASRSPGIGTWAVYLFGLLLITMFFSLYWPLLAVFEQTGTERFRSCLLFGARFLWRTLGCALLQLLYWAVMLLFLPWSVLLLPVTGIWLILFSADFLLYDTMNEVFAIEEQIAEAFPEQAAFYEDDETWLKRRRKEL